MCYSAIVPDVNILEIPQLCCKYRTARWWSQFVKSSEYPAKISCCILANWVGENGQITDDSTVVSAGRVEYFYSQRLQVGNDVDNHVEMKMAFVRWFQEHSCRHSFMKPVEIWSDMFTPLGPASFIPLERIIDVCVTRTLSMNGEVVIAVNPMRKKIFL